MVSVALDDVALRSDSSDSDDVRWALETASAMWSKGDYAETLRWLRRAAETAAEEGADGRAVQLAKIAAELRGQLDVASKPSDAVASAAMSGAPLTSQAPPRTESEETSEPPSEEVFERAAERILNSAPSSAAGWAKMIAIEPDLSDRPTPTPTSPAGESEAETRKIPPAKRPPPIPSAARELPLPTHGAEPPPINPTLPAARNIATHPALRVAVSRSPERNDVLVARILAVGERAPAGSLEGLFVPLEANVDWKEFE